MLLADKNVIIYGAAGAIGSGVARTFAREGACVYLAGRTLARLDAVAQEIRAAGGTAETAVVDVEDERAVEEHAGRIASRAGSLDISLNLVSHGDTDVGGYVQGVPLVDIPPADFFRPIAKGVIANYITARAAARRMAQQGSGVILTLTNAGSTGAMPMMGSTGVVAAAIETFARALAAEVGPSGVRVAGVRIAGIPELFEKDIRTDVFEGEGGGMDHDAIVAMMAQMTLLKRVTTLAQVTGMLAFLASDQAGGMTAEFVNITGGMVVD